MNSVFVFGVLFGYTLNRYTAKASKGKNGLRGSMDSMQASTARSAGVLGMGRRWGVATALARG